MARRPYSRTVEFLSTKIDPMTVLNDSTLRRYASSGMVQPFNPQHISPCSVDLTLGNEILVESLDMNTNGWVPMDITEPYDLKPKQFILATTAETIKLPDDVSAQIILRSSAARAGWNHALSGWIDPGWSGQITLELTNQRQLSFLSVQAGQRLVQLVCFKLNQPAAMPYGLTGNYQNQVGVTPSNNNLSPITDNGSN